MLAFFLPLDLFLTLFLPGGGAAGVVGMREGKICTMAGSARCCTRANYTVLSSLFFCLLFMIITCVFDMEKRLHVMLTQNM